MLEGCLAVEICRCLSNRTQNVDVGLVEGHWEEEGCCAMLNSWKVGRNNMDILYKAEVRWPNVTRLFDAQAEKIGVWREALDGVGDKFECSYFTGQLVSAYLDSAAYRPGRKVGQQRTKNQSIDGRKTELCDTLL
jgi:hypothetical protein